MEGRSGEDEEEEFFNHDKNDLKRHAHTPSGETGRWKFAYLLSLIARLLAPPHVHHAHT